MRRRVPSFLLIMTNGLPPMRFFSSRRSTLAHINASLVAELIDTKQLLLMAKRREDDTKKEKDQTERELAAVKVRRDCEFADMKNRLKEAEEKTEAATRRIGVAENTEKGLRAELAAAEDERDDARTRVAELTSQTVSLHGQIAILKDEVQRLQKGDAEERAWRVVIDNTIRKFLIQSLCVRPNGTHTKELRKVKLGNAYRAREIALKQRMHVVAQLPKEESVTFHEFLKDLEGFGRELSDQHELPAFALQFLTHISEYDLYCAESALAEHIHENGLLGSPPPYLMSDALPAQREDASGEENGE